MGRALTAADARPASTRHWTRWAEWADSKLAWLGTACYYLAATHDWPLAFTVMAILHLFPFVVALAAFGYAVNDYWDRDVDLAAGKKTPAGVDGASRQRWRVLIALVVALVATVPLATSTVSLAATLAFVGMAAAYSAPPLRLKTRGGLGVIAGALGQWGTPVLPLVAAGLAPDIGFVVLLVLGLSAGLRWMLLHQIEDADADARANVRTFTTSRGVSRAAALVRGLTWLELVGLGTWIAVLDGRVRVVVACLSAVYALGLVLVTVARHRREVRELGAFTRAPFRGLYFAWLPLGFLAALALTDHAYLWLVAIDLWWKRYQFAGDVVLALGALGFRPPWRR